MAGKPLHVTIASAIHDGLGGRCRIERSVSESLVYVDGHAEPIVVKADDVILPDDLKPLASGIMLDVQAILASK